MPQESPTIADTPESCEKSVTPSRTLRRKDTTPSPLHAKPVIDIDIVRADDREEWIQPEANMLFWFDMSIAQPVCMGPSMVRQPCDVIAHDGGSIVGLWMVDNKMMKWTSEISLAQFTLMTEDETDPDDDDDDESGRIEPAAKARKVCKKPASDAPTIPVVKRPASISKVVAAKPKVLAAKPKVLAAKPKVAAASPKVAAKPKREVTPELPRAWLKEFKSYEVAHPTLKTDTKNLYSRVYHKCKGKMKACGFELRELKNVVNHIYRQL